MASSEELMESKDAFEISRSAILRLVLAASSALRFSSASFVAAAVAEALEWVEPADLTDRTVDCSGCCWLEIPERAEIPLTVEPPSSPTPFPVCRTESKEEAGFVVIEVKPFAVDGAESTLIEAPAAILMGLACVGVVVPLLLLLLPLLNPTVLEEVRVLICCLLPCPDEGEYMDPAEACRPKDPNGPLLLFPPENSCISSPARSESSEMVPSSDVTEPPVATAAAVAADVAATLAPETPAIVLLLLLVVLL